MLPPWVGEPCSDQHTGRCAYAPHPGLPMCGQPATVHLRVTDHVHGLVELAACDRHAPIARAAAPVDAEHPHEWVCGLPGTVWVMPDNRCAIDDTGVPGLVAAHARELVGAG